MNNLIVIHPYKWKGVWVFDDENTELVREPFVCGADVIIDEMVKNIPDASHGFTLIFSGGPFPGYNATLEWRREDMRGNWYHCVELDMEGWLCPALFKYFTDAPKKIYAQFKEE
jgi:hypothetical protein